MYKLARTAGISVTEKRREISREISAQLPANHMQMTNQSLPLELIT